MPETERFDEGGDFGEDRGPEFDGDFVSGLESEDEDEERGEE